MYQQPLIRYLFDGGKYLAKHKVQLIEFIKGLDKEDNDKIFFLLNCLTSTAKGKRTNFTKKHLNDLKKEI